MPTERGWLLCLSSVLAAVGGRLLGVRALYVVAVAGPALVAGSLVYVRGRRFALDGRRRLVPARLAVGEKCRVELTVTNRGRWRTPELGLADGPEGRFLLGTLVPGEHAGAGYSITAYRRGLVPVGPLRVRLTDPFGVASRVVRTLAAGTLTVHPRTEPVPPPPDPPAGAVAEGPRRPFPSPRAGEDFHALRPYEDGDDLRQVHWPSSARRDELLVRQDEAPRVRHTAVVLDLRRSVHDGATLEAAVSAAASVVAAALDDEGMVRLVTTGGADSGTAGGEAHLEAVLDRLATVAVDGSADLVAAASALGDSVGATLVLVTTTAVSTRDLESLAWVRRSSPLVVAVVFQVTGRPSPPPLPFDRVVRVAPRERFGAAWERAVPAALVDT